MPYPLLDAIAVPADLRQLPRESLAQLARELREFLIESVAKTGGHLSSNLGTVELTFISELARFENKEVGEEPEEEAEETQVSFT